MANIEINAEQKAALVQKLQVYMEQELDVDLGQFDAEFLVDFIGDNIGGYFYNQGLYDAQQLISSKIDLINESLYELEKPVD
ncbi:DUF2164 domain-containing protein [Thalassotalea marina]|uniref:DUF2164 domain-containing protein n=1 Tax=Thalassotalea marina TaxID=1673741 RepID=A0A919BDG3_9GAMM|nr:DUF2164 domain-containing protein [Thalassotalea marina]GHF84111.1 hypothetical protein GCM10017161_09370 [Thalassotalea marina]